MKSNLHTTNPVKKTAGIIILLVGIPFLLAGIWMAVLIVNGIAFQGQRVTATIVDFIRDSDGDRQAVVRYQAGGTLYEAVYDTYHSGMELRDTVEGIFRPERPDRLSSPNTIPVMAGVFGGVGLILTSLALVLLAGVHRKSASIRWLKDNGSRVYALVEEVGCNPNFTVNGYNPRWIVCSWGEGEEKYTFKSDKLMFDPEPYLSDRIAVLIDPENPEKRNYVCIDELRS